MWDKQCRRTSRQGQKRPQACAAAVGRNRQAANSEEDLGFYCRLAASLWVPDHRVRVDLPKSTSESTFQEKDGNPRWFNHQGVSKGAEKNLEKVIRRPESEFYGCFGELEGGFESTLTSSPAGLSAGCNGRTRPCSTRARKPLRTRVLASGLSSFPRSQNSI